MTSESHFWLPEIDGLRKVSQGLALADAIFMRNWELRYFSFNREWNADIGESMASMRDGSGSEYFILFCQAGAAGKVFDSNESRSFSELLSSVPENFGTFKKEPAFNFDSATQFFWRSVEDVGWRVAPEAAQSHLLEPLRLGLDFYHPWAEDYYERVIDRVALGEVFDSLTVTPALLHRLNPAASITEIEGDIAEIVGI